MKKLSVSILIIILYAIFLCPVAISEADRAGINLEEYSKSPPSESNNPRGQVRVGVFNGHGASRGCVIDVIEALKIDCGIVPFEISADDILSRGLNTIDVLLFPGGSGSKQKNNLGTILSDRIKNFVFDDGKGIVGICAGAYLLSDTPDYACLRLLPMKAVDIEHDNRGHGVIAFSVNNYGLKILPELKGYDTAYLQYYEGPLLVPSGGESDKYRQLAAILTDVYLEGDAPPGVTPGKPLFISANVGSGRVFLSTGHPETTPGMRWIVPRMVRWVAGKDLISYPEEVVRPFIYSAPSLFNSDLVQRESKLFQILLYGEKMERISAIGELVEIRSWSARYWMPGLLRDKAPMVRVAAAEALSDLEYTIAINDLKGVIRAERDPAVKKKLVSYLDKLEKMICK